MKLFLTTILSVIVLLSCKSEISYYKTAAKKIKNKENKDVKIKISDNYCYCSHYNFLSGYSIGFDANPKGKDFKKIDEKRFKNFLNENNQNNPFLSSFKNDKDTKFNYIAFFSKVENDSLCVSVFPYDENRKENFVEYAKYNYSYNFLFLFNRKKIKEILVDKVGYE